MFRLPDRPLIPPPGSVAMFGGGEPSELLDAGEWLWLADLCAKAAVPNGTDPAGLSLEDARSLIEARRGAPQPGSAAHAGPEGD